MAKKTAAKKRTRKTTTSPARRGAGRSKAKAGSRSKARSGATRPKSGAKVKRKGGRKAAASNTRGQSRKKTAGRKAARPTAHTKKTGARKSAAKSAKASKSTRKSARKAAPRRKGGTRAAARSRGGTGRERDLAQTPEAGRTVKGPTNPMPTRRSTGTAGGAGSTRRAPGLERQRRQLRELEETIETPPSSLDMDRMASAARTGRAEMRQARREHTETSPALTGGDVDANWQDAYAVGDEAPGGDNPTPDQDRVDDIGRALGVTYEDNEELKAVDKIAERDRHRWELDPASSEDYRTRDKDLDEE